MKFETPLIEGRLIQRYKRFFADVELANGDKVTAHCPNSGSMLSVKDTGARVWLSPASNPDRKLKFTWELVEIFGGLVGINTNHPNRIVADAIAAGEIAQLTGYDSLKREQKYGKNSRIDVLLESDGKPACYVEVKNVTLKRGPGPAIPVEFPDAVTERGTKHLHELSAVAQAGGRAVMFYLVQRGDAARFGIAADIDPAYAAALKTAQKAGVEVLCYGCDVTPNGITIAEPLTVDLPK